MSETVIRAVADAKGVEPTELGTPLYNRIDPDALDRLFQPKADGTTRAGCRVEFTIANCDVVVDSDGGVTVTPPERSGASSTVVSQD